MVIFHSYVNSPEGISPRNPRGHIHQEAQRHGGQPVATWGVSPSSPGLTNPQGGAHPGMFVGL